MIGSLTSGTELNSPVTAPDLVGSSAGLVSLAYLDSLFANNEPVLAGPALSNNDSVLLSLLANRDVVLAGAGSAGLGAFPNRPLSLGPASNNPFGLSSLTSSGATENECFFGTGSTVALLSPKIPPFFGLSLGSGIGTGVGAIVASVLSLTAAFLITFLSIFLEDSLAALG